MVQAIVVGSGLSAYQSLQDTKDRQLQTLQEDPVVAREVAYFRENIGSVQSASDLVADRRLLEIALTAYGLESEIDKGFLIEQALDGGSDDPNAFARRLNEQSWVDLAAAFGFGDAGAGREKPIFQIAVEQRLSPPAADDTPAAGQLPASEMEYLRANLPLVASVDDLLDDTRLRDATLTAWGIDPEFILDDFVEQVLTEDPLNPTAIVNDEAYSAEWRDFAIAFQGLAEDRTVETLPRFVQDVEVALATTSLVSIAEADADPTLLSQGDLNDFRARIGEIATAADPAAALANDPDLLKVALVAYDLGGSSKSTEEIADILRDGGGDGSLARAEADFNWVLLTNAFNDWIGGAPDVTVFELETEVRVAANRIEFVPEETPSAPDVDPEDLAYFQSQAREIDTVDALLADQRFLDVALTAFGLDDQNRSEAFLRDILSEDPLDPNAFVNIISDTRWKEFSEAFRGVGETANGLARLDAVESRLVAQDADPSDIAYLRRNVDLLSDGLSLVIDPRLTGIALSAFGLDPNAFSSDFIVSMIISDPSDPNSLVNVFGDPNWQAFVEVFTAADVGQSNVRTQSFQDEVIGNFYERRFEIAVGEQNDDLRIALNFEREIQEIASNPSADVSQWFPVMGDEPMLRVIRATFNLPPEFSNLAIESQNEIFQQRSLALFGGSNPDVFADPANVDIALQRFFAAQEAAAFAQGGLNSTALTLVSSATSGALSILA